MKFKIEASSIFFFFFFCPWVKYTAFSESLSNWKLGRRNTDGAQVKAMEIHAGGYAESFQNKLLRAWRPLLLLKALHDTYSL